ncbi:class I SAM-dependent methyltransferase [Patescibacteria group bacterium]|nr:class I SAM-dependent methyltransferase [Patescibacteria group bacterium]
MKSTSQSEKEYKDWFDQENKDVFMEEIEYYKVIGSLLKGKKSVDLGCGYGSIETFSPDTVGVDFSEVALERARKRGIKNLVKADIQKLPFKDDEFEISLSNGVLEHIEDIEKAISEMVRVSEIQIIIVHAALPYGLELIRKPLMKLFGFKDQPIENPQTLKSMKNYLEKYGARIIIEGVWNYIDLRWISENIPYGFLKWPSHHFLVSIKTKNLGRKFLGKHDFSSTE